MTDDDTQPVEEMTVTSGEVVSAPDVTGEWLAPPAAADRLGISERTLWRRVKEGRYHSRVVDRKAEILVPDSGAKPTTGGLASLPDTSANGRAVAELVEHLSRQSMTVTRQAVQITRLTADRQHLEDERDALAEKLAAAENRASTAEAALRARRWWNPKTW